MAERPFTTPSLAAPSPRELQALRANTARERAWYASHPRYGTNEDILAAARGGTLVFVNPDRNSTPVGRFRNPEFFHRFPPYLLPSSELALRAVGRLWRHELEEQDILLPKVRLAVTSMARSDEVQQELVRRGKLADPESTHRSAAAFDIDASGYYMYDASRQLVPVVHPGRDKAGRQEVTRLLQAEVEWKYDTPTGAFIYDQRVPDALLRVTDRLHEMGAINRIVEYVGEPNQCVHIAPNPAATAWLEAA